MRGDQATCNRRHLPQQPWHRLTSRTGSIWDTVPEPPREQGRGAHTVCAAGKSGPWDQPWAREGGSKQRPSPQRASWAQLPQPLPHPLGSSLRKGSSLAGPVATPGSDKQGRVKGPTKVVRTCLFTQLHRGHTLPAYQLNFISRHDTWWEAEASGENLFLRQEVKGCPLLATHTPPVSAPRDQH